MFNTSALFSGPTDGVVRSPGGGAANPLQPGGSHFDMNAIMDHLRSLYPGADDTALQGMATSQMNTAQTNRSSAMQQQFSPFTSAQKPMAPKQPQFPH